VGAQIFLSFPSRFLAVQVQLVVLVSAFVMGNTVWSISCFFFGSSTHGARRAQPFVKVGARAPLCSVELVPLLVGKLSSAMLYLISQTEYMKSTSYTNRRICSL